MSLEESSWDYDAAEILDWGRSVLEFQEAFGDKQDDFDGQGVHEEIPWLDRSQDVPSDRWEACGPFQDAVSLEAFLGSHPDALVVLLVVQEGGLPFDLPLTAAQLQLAWLHCVERLARPAHEFDYARLLEEHRFLSRRGFREAHRLSFGGVDDGRASIHVRKVTRKVQKYLYEKG